MNLREAIECRLGAGLQPAEVDAIAALADVRSFNGGDTIVRQFDKNSDLLVILDGSARVNTFSGEQIVEIGPGSVVGEISLVDDQPRSATVLSVRGTKAAVIPSERFRELMHHNPSIDRTIMRNISRSLAAHVRLANLHMDGLMAGK